MRVLSVVLVALALAAQHQSARAEDFLVEETLGDVVSNNNDAGGEEQIMMKAESGVDAGDAAGVNAGGDADVDGARRKLLYTAPQVVTTTAPAGVNCAWGAWSAWSTCYQNAYSKDEPLRCNLGVSRRTRVKTTYQTLDGTCAESTNDCVHPGGPKAAKSARFCTPVFPTTCCLPMLSLSPTASDHSCQPCTSYTTGSASPPDTILSSI